MSRRVLITAGASGVGLAIARIFDRDGWQIWVADVDATALKMVPEHWRRSLADVTDETAVAAMFAEIAADWGGVDAVCANAGIAGPTAAVEDIELVDWQRCVAVNLEGTFLISKHAVLMMKTSGTGAIIVTSSTAGQYGYPFRAAYSAAKWAVIGFAKTLAMEVGASGLRVNVICPGAVEGPRMEGVLEREAVAKGMSRDSVYKGYASGTAMGQFVEGADIGEMAVFLASDAARLVSGQVIAVDGFTVNPDPKV